MFFTSMPVPSPAPKWEQDDLVLSEQNVSWSFIFFGAAEEEEEGTVFVAVNLLHYKRLTKQNFVNRIITINENCRTLCITYFYVPKACKKAKTCLFTRLDVTMWCCFRGEHHLSTDSIILRTVFCPVCLFIYPKPWSYPFEGCKC